MNIFKNHPDITSVKSYGIDDLKKTDFYEKNKVALERGNVTHYFGNKQKIYVIYQELLSVEQDTYILYQDCITDAADTKNLNISLLPHIKACDENRGIITSGSGVGDHIHQRYTSPTCLENLNMTQFKSKFQPCASWILVKNTPFIRRIIGELMSWFEIEGCTDYVTFYERDKEKDKEFIQHRGDQSLLGLIILKYNLKYLNCGSKCVFHPTNFNLCSAGL